jgi:hypothetical protein
VKCIVSAHTYGVGCMYSLFSTEEASRACLSAYKHMVYVEFVSHRESFQGLSECIQAWCAIYVHIV